MKYYIGVDGGGSKTIVALFNQYGEILRRAVTGGSNHEYLQGSYKEAVNCIYESAKKVLHEEGIDLYHVNAWSMGLSGADHKHQIETLKNEFEKLSISNIHIYNDGYLPLLAASETGVGIAYNTGTGSCAVGIDNQGETLQIGGLNDFSGDMGNGKWLIQKSWQAVYDEIYLFGEETALTTAYCELFNISDRKNFSVTANYILDTNDDLFKNAISLFFKVLESKDSVALEIARTMAHRGALMIKSVYKNLNYDQGSLEVVLAGSIQVKAASKFYLNLLHEEIQIMLGINFKMILLEKEPVYGAFKYLSLNVIKNYSSREKLLL